MAFPVAEGDRDGEAVTPAPAALQRAWEGSGVSAGLAALSPPMVPSQESLCFMAPMLWSCSQGTRHAAFPFQDDQGKGFLTRFRDSHRTPMGLVPPSPGEQEAGGTPTI